MGIEQGEEVYIPKELAQNKLPQSFRYYDPAIKIAQELMAPDKKLDFAKKNEAYLESYGNKDKQKQFLNQMGLDFSNSKSKHEAMK